ncbi:MAG: MATE family efflux transporter [Candidatus Cloacimonetes bacterium]|nr:MATE family efflux transporter [Candidatus Cloacimonadota bacterium]
MIKRSNQKNSILADENILRLLLNLSAPATIGMITMALYNLVDTIFVGRGVGPLAIAGLAIVFPFQMLVLALGQMIGMGAASIISRSLGAEDKERAEKALANMILSTSVFGITLAVSGNIFLSPLLRAFGATEAIMPYSREYLQVILMGTVFHIFLISSNNVIRAEGRAAIAMGTMIVSAVLNIILDPVFIFVLKMGVRGAAIATVISQAVAAGYIIGFFKSGISELQLRQRFLKPDWEILREKFAIGLSAFVRQAAGSIFIIVVNHSLAYYGTDLTLAAFGVIHRLLRFTIMPVFGIAQGMQPIVGYNYGARRPALARKAISLATWGATIMAITGFILLFAFPATLIAIFTDNRELIATGSKALRIIVCVQPLIGVQIIGATTFQALGKALPSLFLSMSRQLLFLIPLLLILPRLLALNGVWLAFPLADIMSFFITLIILIPQLKKLLRPQQQVI